ncbi:hypothetical protein X798_08143 [Onchocerca flexuosa]|uniref:Uncharacterized protein n=1 Tax=Onchocerca flexuosa TaxID=387005 RepID=A0A238BI52_9BILA|nr:hypothetical protein X798_08143 [Onchocerca flexuosa]
MLTVGLSGLACKAVRLRHCLKLPPNANVQKRNALKFLNTEMAKSNMHRIALKYKNSIRMNMTRIRQIIALRKALKAGPLLPPISKRFDNI